MSLHLVIEDNTEDPQVPEPTVCPNCKGEGKFYGRRHWWYCPACRCDVCGDTTETAPLCVRCDIAQDAAYERRQDV